MGNYSASISMACSKGRNQRGNPQGWSTLVEMQIPAHPNFAKALGFPTGFFFTKNYFLPSNAFSRVSSSAYSISPPTGIPFARCVILKAGWGITSFIDDSTKADVARPSEVGFNATIISEKLPDLTRFFNSSTLSWLKSSFFIVATVPPRIKYSPLYFPVLSKDIKSVSFSTMQSKFLFLLGSEHIWHKPSFAEAS